MIKKIPGNKRLKQFWERLDGWFVGCYSTYQAREKTVYSIKEVAYLNENIIL